MPTLVEQIQSVLNPVVAGGSFYAVNTLEMNENTVFPYATFLFVSSSTNNTFSGATDLQNTRVQVDVYSDTVQGLLVASAASAAAMSAAPFSNVQLTSQDGYEDQVRAYRRSLDFSVWSTN